MASVAEWECEDLCDIIAAQHARQDDVARDLAKVLPWVRPHDARPAWCQLVGGKTKEYMLRKWRRTVERSAEDTSTGYLRVFCVCHGYAPLTPAQVLVNLGRCNTRIFQLACEEDPDFLAKWGACVQSDVLAGRPLAGMCMLLVLSVHRHVGYWANQWLLTTACTEGHALQPYAAKVLLARCLARLAVEDDDAPKRMHCTCDLGSVIYALSLVPHLRHQRFESRAWKRLWDHCLHHGASDADDQDKGPERWAYSLVWSRPHAARVVTALLAESRCVRQVTTVCRCNTDSICVVEVCADIVCIRLMQPPSQFALPTEFYDTVLYNDNFTRELNGRQGMLHLLCLLGRVPDALVVPLLQSESVFPMKEQYLWALDCAAISSLLRMACVPPRRVVTDLMRRMTPMLSVFNHDYYSLVGKIDMSKYVAYSQRWSVPRGLWLTALGPVSSAPAL